eukprot:TRINITY_DN2884_c0_g1_i1.p1 TRINITY_DN2884_c0_g1~~TRINITY_DN2884_c0_g1_i1.p1  ORF type:complete len:160 (-),score=28.42 TRINITY_DN2884_c0_g1_i1:91-570(-)
MAYRLQGIKWIVDSQKGTKESPALIGPIEVAVPKQSVYIFNNQWTVVEITGKISSVLIEGSSGIKVSFGDIVAHVEVLNSENIELYANGAVPTISVEKSHSVTINLESEAALGAKISTSLSTTVNVNTPVDKNGFQSQHLVPERFVSSFVGGKLVTVPL